MLEVACGDELLREPAAASSVCRARHRTLPSSPWANGRRASGSNSRMRVAVDGRALRPGTARARGVARYLRSLLEQLERPFPRMSTSWSTLAAPASRPRRSAGRPRLDRSAAGGDVVWLPAPAPAAVSPGGPYVLTVHDLSFEHRPLDYSAYDRAWHRLARPARLARGAALVLCVLRGHPRAAIGAWDLRSRPHENGAAGPRPDPRQGREALAGLPERLLPRRRGARAAQAPRRDRGRTPACARPAGFARSLVFAGDGPLRGKLEGVGRDGPRPRLRRGARLALRERSP